MISIGELANRILAKIDADREAYQKTEQYRKARMDLARAERAVEQDEPCDPSANRATSDYDWLTRRGE